MKEELDLSDVFRPARLAIFATYEFWIRALFVIMILLSFVGCKTYRVTMTWTQPSYLSVTGFKVYGGAVSHQYSSSIDLGKPAPIAVHPDGSADYRHVQLFNPTQYRKYNYLAMTAYNATKESGFSNEVNLRNLIISESTPPPTPIVVPGENPCDLKIIIHEGGE